MKQIYLFYVLVLQKYHETIFHHVFILYLTWSKQASVTKYYYCMFIWHLYNDIFNWMRKCVSTYYISSNYINNIFCLTFIKSVKIFKKYMYLYCSNNNLPNVIYSRICLNKNCPERHFWKQNFSSDILSISIICQT